MKRVLVCVGVVSIVALATVSAQVKTEQKTQFKFAGPLGSVVNFFGGKSAREGVVETVVVSGNRKLTTTENSGQIIDLGEEKVYDLDLRGKSYKVTTFDEIRRRMQEAQDRARKDAERNEGKKSDKPEKEYQIDVDAKDTGQRKAINSFDCHQVITTITVHEKGKTVDEAGGLILTSDSWLAPTIASMKEVADFDRRYAEKLLGADAAVAAEQMAAAFAMYPGLKEAMGKMQASGANASGTAILTAMTIDNVKSPEQVSQQKSNDQPSAGMGGMLGGLGRRIGRKKEEPASADKPANRSTFLTINHEVLSVSTSVDPSAVAIPAGFRQK